VREIRQAVRFSFFLSLCLSLVAHAQGLSSGTGFFVTPNGHIATNFHVVEGSTKVSVRDTRGNVLDAEILATDRANDLAILRVKGTGFSYLPIRPSSDVRKGESVYALGFPNIQMQGLEAKITSGIVSSLSGIVGEPNTFQISVPVQPGNSGGPLFDKSGKAVGVVVAKLSATAAVKAGAGIPENVNYAVKSNYLLELIHANSNILGALPSRIKQSNADFPTIVEQVELATVLVIASIPIKANVQATKSVEPEPRQQGAPVPSTTEPDSGAPIGAYCNWSSDCKAGNVCIKSRCQR
jgi:hypothetical protein